ncbi:type I-B CRISPR-associated endonuclease Cas1b [Thermocrinis sp.]|uniref:type I-B CRISPR-associated endonuclease Cas1b n=1 Tax=Thermocrinis sp. TaxID=2024383 RepID=UPI002FDE53F1
MAEIYYITTNGTLKRDENTIFFENGDIKKKIPVENTSELFILAEVSTNTRFFSFLSQYGITAHFFNYYGYYIGSFYPREKNLSGYLLIKQVEHYLDKEKRLYLAKSFVLGSIVNSEKLYRIDVSEYLKRLKQAFTIEAVMQVEGSFKKLCYKTLEKLTGWDFETRTKRPPQNPLNALISFGNSLVYAKVLGEIYHTPLNSTVSYLHEPSEKRHSLCLDVAEVFKPMLSEGLILELIKSGTITERDFLEEAEYCYLNTDGKKKFLKAFDNLLKSTVYHPKLKRNVSLKTLIRLELYKLIKHLAEDETYLPLDYYNLKQ